MYFNIILINTNIFQQSFTKALCYKQNYHMVPLSQSYGALEKKGRFRLTCTSVLIVTTKYM